MLRPPQMDRDCHGLAVRYSPARICDLQICRIAVLPVLLSGLKGSDKLRRSVSGGRSFSSDKKAAARSARLSRRSSRECSLLRLSNILKASRST